MSSFQFGSKAQTLEALSGRLKSAVVLPLAHFTVAEWRAHRKRTLDKIAGEAWAGQDLIVRSSAASEDRVGGSMAGHFRTVPDVCGVKALEEAVESVIASYAGAEDANNRVLVQPMLRNVTLSGVAFSQDPNTGSPYIVINCSLGADTTAVTGGRCGELLTHYHWKLGTTPCAEPFDSVVALVTELEQLAGTGPLDIEFARDSGGRLFLLQVRRLLAGTGAGPGPERQTRALEAIAHKIDSANRPHPFLHGKRTIYGVMPDWNPAEIVGIRPRPLSLSLYREIVTDSIWAYQRHNYGYKNLRSFPLLVDFHGLPYIDVRVSFNSFVPADVPAELADRLVDYYIESLAAAPTLHDKVEFEIVLSCYSFDLPDRLAKLAERGFAQEDCALLRASLNRLTNRIIHRETGLWRRDMERIQDLSQRHATVMAAELDTVSRIYWLIEDCKRYGTLPFAGLARAGFVAVQILNSLVASGVLSAEERALFMTGLDTVSAGMARDLTALDRDAFLKKYGHLRPGTYDILSPRYDEAPDRYFDWSHSSSQPRTRERAPFSLSLNQMRAVRQLLDQHQLEHDVVGLFEFFEAGIRGREYAKFMFTRNLSDALSLIGTLGAEHGYTLDDMSYVPVATILGLHAASRDARSALGDAIARGRESHAMSKALVLPPLIGSSADVWSFRMPPTEPNYITQKTVSGGVVSVTPDAELAGKIAMIANADPGYDWIFSRGICGFITAYGGVNSHMAVRASELALPAVIGAGEVLFAKWSAARKLEIDTANRQVRILQ